MTSYNPETTSLLAKITDTLPIVRALALPIAELRAEVNRLGGLVYVYERLSHIDEDGATALEALNYAIARARRATRDEVLEGLGAVASELADRVTVLLEAEAAAARAARVEVAA